MRSGAAMAVAFSPSVPLSALPALWPGHDARLWGMAALAMSALHAGAVAVAVLWQPEEPPPPPPAAAMMVELAPMTAPPAPPTEKPPGIEQRLARPVEVPPEDLPKPTPVVKKADVALPKPKARPQPKQVEEMAAAPRVEDQTSAPKAADLPPAPNVAAAPLQAPVPVPMPPSNALPSWQGALRAHLERYKRYPAAAQSRRQQGVAHVRFAMGRDGSLRWARLERGSGYDRLDEEALALMERAHPLPAVPDEIGGEIVEIVVPIQFFLK